MAFSRIQALQFERSFKAASAFSANVASITAFGRAMAIPPQLALFGEIINYYLLHVNANLVLILPRGMVVTNRPFG
jgi:hypothetical protein